MLFHSKKEHKFRNGVLEKLQKGCLATIQCVRSITENGIRKFHPDMIYHLYYLVGFRNVVHAIYSLIYFGKTKKLHIYKTWASVILHGKKRVRFLLFSSSIYKPTLFSYDKRFPNPHAIQLYFSFFFLNHWHFHRKERAICLLLQPYNRMLNSSETTVSDINCRVH